MATQRQVLWAASGTQQPLPDRIILLSRSNWKLHKRLVTACSLPHQSSPVLPDSKLLPLARLNTDGVDNSRANRVEEEDGSVRLAKDPMIEPTSPLLN